MSFYDIYLNYKDFNFESYFEDIKDEDVISVLNKNKIDKLDFLTLLSPVASKHLELIANKAHELSLKHFGKAILLYTPLYISNYCVNKCLYCSYNIENEITRKKLSLQEIEEEAKIIASSGLKHILILSGESRKHTSIEYIKDCVKILKKYFDSIGIEIYPLTTEEYKEVIEVGVDGLTIYQEVYDEEIYKKVHVKGPKANYKFRLDAPERACKAGIRSANIGSLLGLNDWRKEAFITGIHGKYLQDKYTEVELSMSLPRIKEHVGEYNEILGVNDKDLVQIMLALRIFLPSLGLTMSTRESENLRNNLIPLGVTKMSAGVSTEVGGHTLESTGNSQFEISDNRSVKEIKNVILSKGYQPIFKDWCRF